MSQRGDREWRTLFATLRDEERVAAPPFRMPTAAPSHITRLQVAGGTAILAIAAGALMIVTAESGIPDRVGPIDMDTTGWESPTDFLLDTPGVDLIRSVPVLATQSLTTNDQRMSEDDTLEE